MQPNRPDSPVVSNAKGVIENIKILLSRLSVRDKNSEIIISDIDVNKIKISLEDSRISVYYDNIIQFHIKQDGSIYSADKNHDNIFPQDLYIDDLIDSAKDQEINK